MEMSLAKRLLGSTFLFLAKYCSSSSRNFFAFSPLEIEPRNAFIECLMIIMHIRLERPHFSIFASLEVRGFQSESESFHYQCKIQIHIIENNSTASFQTLKFYLIHCETIHLSKYICSTSNIN